MEVTRAGGAQSSGGEGVAPLHPEPMAGLLVQARREAPGALSTVDSRGEAPPALALGASSRRALTACSHGALS